MVSALLSVASSSRRPLTARSVVSSPCFSRLSRRRWSVSRSVMASIDAVAPGSRFFTAATAPLTEPFTAVAAEERADGFFGSDALRPRGFAFLRAAAARAALRLFAAFAVARRARVFAVFFAAVLRRVAFLATVPPRPAVPACRAEAAKRRRRVGDELTAIPMQVCAQV